ncbi:MAG: hypothetical protein KDD62_16425, partial [Bdellovibrionales bacterium]|nr:hypothetical protein [Bdellovibrionales bacterium]
EGTTPSSLIARGTVDATAIYEHGWAGLGNNSVQRHDFDTALGAGNRFVNRLEIVMPNGGAVAEVQFCSTLLPPKKPKEGPLPEVTIVERCTVHAGSEINWQLTNENNWPLNLHWRLFNGETHVESGILSLGSESVKTVTTEIGGAGAYRFELYEKTRKVTEAWGYSNECGPDPTPTPVPTPTPEPEGYIRSISECVHPNQNGKTLNWSIENGYPIAKQVSWRIEGSNQSSGGLMTLEGESVLTFKTAQVANSANVLVVEDGKGSVLDRRAASYFVCDIPRLPSGALQAPIPQRPIGTLYRGSEGPHSVDLNWEANLPEGYSFDYIDYEFKIESLNDQLREGVVST